MSILSLIFAALFEHATDPNTAALHESIVQKRVLLRAHFEATSMEAFRLSEEMLYGNAKGLSYTKQEWKEMERQLKKLRLIANAFHQQWSRLGYQLSNL